MLVRAQNEEKERRKRAAWIAKEVRWRGRSEHLRALLPAFRQPAGSPWSAASAPEPVVCVVQVMGFWSKAQRVVLYKVRTEVEARKKEVMDKQVGGCWTSKRVGAGQAVG